MLSAVGEYIFWVIRFYCVFVVQSNWKLMMKEKKQILYLDCCVSFSIQTVANMLLYVRQQAINISSHNVAQ